jgi:predicted Zn-dependent protease
MRYAVALVSLVLVVAACTTVPITGRRQVHLVPASTMLSMSFQQYSEFLDTNPPVAKTDTTAATVERVGRRIQQAVEAFFSRQGMSQQLSGYQWEFRLVDDPEPNAWCMPGGKVVVYTGILPLTQTETGLAVVMGHEIAHAVANHGNERMSQQLITEMGGMALSTAMSQRPEETRQLWMTAFGLGAQYGLILPYGRLHETEADRLGLIFMAMAGYDPNEAVAFWERMSAASQGGSPPAFLSTHPSNAARIRKIREILPEAMRYYPGS